jgi:predicted amidohydrolase YtcJ
MRWAEARVGPARLRGAYAWRRLAPDATQLAFGSDVPVEDPDPLRGIYAARTRTDARGEPRGGWLSEQCLTAAEALAAFTSGASRAGHQNVGRLEPGAPADFAVLDVDPLRASSEELLGARVLATVVQGEIVYAAR